MEITETDQKNQSDVQASLVVFGKDESGKAHAAKFSAADAELALRAAGLMAMKVLRITTDEHRDVASGLGEGRIFASGKALTPYVKMAVYDRLNGFKGAFQPPPIPAELQPEPAENIAAVTKRCSDLKAGDVVLATTGEAEGWFEAIIIEPQSNDLFLLSWRDYPEYKDFIRSARHLALLPETFSP